MVKNLSALRETRVQSLGQKDPVEKKIATHSSILAWRIPWTEELGATVNGVAELDTIEELSTHFGLQVNPRAEPDGRHFQSL